MGHMRRTYPAKYEEYKAENAPAAVLGANKKLARILHEGGTV
jgi:hypothetical protein